MIGSSSSSSRKNNNHHHKKKVVGDAYLTTQELQEKLLAEQARIRWKRQSMRDEASKRQQRQAQQMLQGGGHASLLFANYTERDTTDDDDDDDSFLGPDYAATPLDALTDSMTNLCAPTASSTAHSIVGGTYTVVPPKNVPTTHKYYYPEALEDTASLSLYSTTDDEMAYKTTTTDDEGHSLAYESEISSLTDNNRYRKPWFLKQQQQQQKNEEDFLRNHPRHHATTIVQEYLEQQQQEKKKRQQKQQTSSQSIGESSEQRPPPIKVVRTPSKMTTMSKATNKSHQSSGSEDTLGISANSILDNATSHSDDEWKRTEKLLIHTVSMLDREDDEEIETIAEEQQSLASTLTSAVPDDDDEENPIMELLKHQQSTTAEKKKKSPEKKKSSPTLESSLSPNQELLRTQKELAQQQALERLRELSQQERDRQREEKEQRLISNYRKRRRFLGCCCLQKKCVCNQYCICRHCTLRYLVVVACAVLLLLCIVGVVLLLVDPFRQQPQGNSSSSSVIEDVRTECPLLSTQRITNLLPECQCRTELPQPLSSEISFYRKLLLQYLVNAQIIPYTDDDNDIETEPNAQPQQFNNDDIAQLFVQGETSCHPYNQVLLFLTNADKASSDDMGLTALAHRFVLMLLYQVLGGSEWVQQTNWKSSSTGSVVGVCEDWYGIGCSPYDELLQIELPNNNLRGNLTTVTQVLGRGLPNLRFLDLGHNEELTDGPRALEALLNERPPTTLQKLDWSHISSSSSGTIPTEIGRLSRLTELRLDHGPWTGPLPTELGLLTQLRILDVSHNALTGTLPDELGQLTQLRQLSVSNNFLTGPLPDGPYANWKLLESLDVSHNGLTGTLPQSWKDWNQLHTLVVQDNDWEVPVRLPDEPYGWNLQYLFLSQSEEEVAMVPESYCTDLLYLDVLRAGCPLDDNQQTIVPCPCCNCG